MISELDYHLPNLHHEPFKKLVLYSDHRISFNSLKPPSKMNSCEKYYIVFIIYLFIYEMHTVFAFKR